ncbi:signal peptidase I [Frigoribacterium sp. CG_9.8]|uniref:signal peptidase I n=1 Tax=Frigoribacterium sp. CG_9.8 TaxID=2787733 RepID=UPI0018CA2BD2|nr:signal peptidase I [Frigoribacterium sp. CG_9.8]MBG6107048.1 signal peptidase I [Frigoribacterium sp. CG_9.8]
MTDIGPATSTEDAAENRHSRSRGVKLFLRDIVLIVVAAVIISVGIKAFLIRSFYIPSGSMENTLQIDDRIIVNELVPRMFPVQHGDVVVFTDPGGWLPPQTTVQRNGFVAGVDWVLSVVGLSAPDSNDHLVKRVIGLPGDTVTCCNAFGQMTVNGIPLVETYLKLPNGVTKVAAKDFSVTVPKNSLWVMGDNRYNSEDSRAHAATPSKGFVPMDQVVGRAFLISWPTSHWTWLDDYPDVFGGVTAANPGTVK